MEKYEWNELVDELVMWSALEAADFEDHRVDESYIRDAIRSIAEPLDRVSYDDIEVKYLTGQAQHNQNDHYVARSQIRRLTIEYLRLLKNEIDKIY